ncbi:MAG: hypothetical protein LBP58_00110 [Azoarcus sp.]|jgi:hypothetical protein|nr:hypothetical protein [Azoarcus sp.]
MMITFLLITSSTHKPDVHSFVKSPCTLEKDLDGRYIAYGPTGMEDGWIAISYVEGVEDDYEPEELEKIKNSIPDPCFFLVEVGDRPDKASFLDWFIMNLDNPENFMIDNDHGLIMSAKSVQDRIRGRIEWLLAEQ